ncbi:hypothetical protein DL769_009550 [Monosporascus sp. CRB-8-3]|nr:hypothetical protein DL769_009550 [Monosporascus sp. CRB-8-3]
MAPSSQKQWSVSGKDKGFDGLQLVDAPVPKVGENDVLVKLHAASLNYRDLIIPKGMYPFPANFPVVACSDGAGEVVEVGSKVSRFAKGDRVVTLFNQGHQFGPVDIAASHTGLGGAIDGTLRQYAVFNENGLVRAPRNLDYAEASTLTCAALTSWNALYGLKPLRPGETVLVQGTGGVSVFALQFAKAAGATVIATTSSDEKAQTLKRLGAHHVINYKEDANWGETAKKLTPGGAGVDHVVEVGGAGTLEQSLKAVKFEGVISVIGFLGGAKATPSIIECLNNLCTARGVYVGSRALMEDMVRAIEANDIRPVVDERVFDFEKAREAYEYQWSQKHFGKVVIKIASTGGTRAVVLDTPRDEKRNHIAGITGDHPFRNAGETRSDLRGHRKSPLRPRTAQPARASPSGWLSGRASRGGSPARPTPQRCTGRGRLLVAPGGACNSP